MTQALPRPAFKKLDLTRFDGIVLTTLLSLALLTALLIWRGNQIGVRIVNVTPAPDAAAVSTRSVIQVTFDQPIVVPNSDPPLTLSPPVTGTVRWEETTLFFAPVQPLAPETSYTVTLDETLQGIQSSSIEGSLTWQFQTGRPRLLYMAPDAGEQDQLYVIDPAGGEPTQLTNEAFGVADYSLSPDGSLIAYAARREDQGSDLWAVRPDGSEPGLLLACPNSVCSQVAWKPTGDRFIYERRNFIIPGAAPGPPRLWWFDLADKETVPVFEDQQAIGYGAGWSADGRWLAYISPDTQGVQIYNPTDDRSLVIPSRMGSIPVWHPQANELLVTDIQPGNEGFAVHLLRVSPESGQLVDLSAAQPLVEDSAPAWSPTGEWIAFTRKAAGASMGKQIWLMRPDGSQARYLTADPALHHGLPAWSPDGRSLAFQRFPLKEVGALPGLWVLELETDRLRALVPVGNRPTWLP